METATQFIDLRKELKNIMFEQLRQDRDDYLEAVVIKSELAKLVLALEKYLGAGTTQPQLPKEIGAVLKELGGIMKGQALYFKDTGQEKIIAMLWPWQDEVRTTVKIIKKTT